VPAIPEADEIRADLIAARDTPRRLPPPQSKHADPTLPPQIRSACHRLAIVVTRADDPEEEPEYLISLAGTLFVSWPSSIVPPRLQYQVVPMFD
jgi:hypothetical protein